MNWKQEDLERIYKEANIRAQRDPAFRELAMRDPKAAYEQLSGQPMPDDFKLEVVEKDESYAATYVVPDFAQGELDFRQLSDQQAEKVAGGLSIFLIVSICGAAISTGGCGGDACGANACGGNVCGGNVCGADACGGNACGGNADAGGACAGAACGADACGGNAGCAGYAAGTSTCGGYVGCAGDAG